MGLMHAANAVVIGLGILLAIAAIIVVRERWRREEQRQRMADAAFEAEALALARSAGLSSSSDAVHLGFGTSASTVTTDSEMLKSPPEGAPTTPFLESTPAPTAVHVPVPVDAEVEVPYIRQPAEVTCQAVMRQLQNAGMVEQQEGYLELHGNPRAALSLKLKGGRHCLVVPYHETEIFAQCNLKRFQMLIYVGRDGKGTVLTSLEDTIASKVGGSFGM